MSTQWRSWYCELNGSMGCLTHVRLLDPSCAARTSRGRNRCAPPTMRSLSPSPLTSTTRIGTLAEPRSKSSWRVHFPRSGSFGASSQPLVRTKSPRPSPLMSPKPRPWPVLGVPDGEGFELPGALPLPVGDELVDHQRMHGRVGDDLEPPVAVDVPRARGLDVAALGDYVLRPRPALFAGVLAPAERVAPPAAGDEVEIAVAVDVHGDGGEVVEIVADGLDVANLVARAEIGPFVPPRAGDDVETLPSLLTSKTPADS